MKNLIRDIKGILRSKRGELVLESIVSLLMFSILLAGVSAMLQTSIMMISVSIRNAKELQEQTINKITLSEYEYSSEAVLTLTHAYGSASHEIVFNDSDIIAFVPDGAE